MICVMLSMDFNGVYRGSQTCWGLDIWNQPVVPGMFLLSNFVCQTWQCSEFATGWWFGTFGLCFHNILGIIIPTDELIFFKIVFNHQPDLVPWSSQPTRPHRLPCRVQWIFGACEGRVIRVRFKWTTSTAVLRTCGRGRGSATANVPAMGKHNTSQPYQWIPFWSLPSGKLT